MKITKSICTHTKKKFICRHHKPLKITLMGLVVRVEHRDHRRRRRFGNNCVNGW